VIIKSGLNPEIKSLAMQHHCLVLYPLDHATRVDPQQLQQALAATGLTGELHDWQGEQHFLAGEHFLERVTFLGCSPFIHLVPPENDAQGSDYCHIVVKAQGNELAFLGGDNVRTPRCPHCRQTLDDWQQGLEHSEVFSCSHCGKPAPLSSLNWRRSAAFARSSVWIYGIHDGEAVPSERLMTDLVAATGCAWGYFYSQSR
jgi:hypothetical protein